MIKVGKYIKIQHLNNSWEMLVIQKNIYTNEKAMKNHMKALKKRGAKVKKSKTSKGWKLEYNF